MNKYYKIECELQKDLLLGQLQNNHLVSLTGTISVNESGLAEGIATNTNNNCNYLLVGFVDPNLGLVVKLLNLEKDSSTRTHITLQGLAAPLNNAFAGEFFLPGAMLAQHLGYFKVNIAETKLNASNITKLTKIISLSVNKIKSMKDQFLASSYNETLHLKPSQTKHFLTTMQKHGIYAGPYNNVFEVNNTINN